MTDDGTHNSEKDGWIHVQGQKRGGGEHLRRAGGGKPEEWSQDTSHRRWQARETSSRLFWDARLRLAGAIHPAAEVSQRLNIFPPSWEGSLTPPELVDGQHQGAFQGVPGLCQSRGAARRRQPG